MSQAVTGPGTLLKRGDGGAPEAFASVAEVLDINGPQRSRDFEDVSHQESPNKYKEFKALMKDGGTLDFDLNWLPATASQDALNDDYEDGVLRNWQLVWTQFTPNVTASFSAFVASPPNPTSPVDGKLTGSCSLKISGPVTFA